MNTIWRYHFHITPITVPNLLYMLNKLFGNGIVGCHVIGVIPALSSTARVSATSAGIMEA